MIKFACFFKSFNLMNCSLWKQMTNISRFEQNGLVVLNFGFIYFPPFLTFDNFLKFFICLIKQQYFYLEKQVNIEPLIIMVKSFSLEVTCAVLFVIATVNAQNSTTNDTTEVTVPSWLNGSVSNYNNFLQDQYNYFITKEGNKVWSGVMNLAWSEMKRNFLRGQNATFANTTELQQHIIDNLNSQVFSKDQLSEDAYYVFSGYGQKSIDRINFEVRQKFPLRTLPNLDYILNEQDFISFAYLFKKFQYKSPFDYYPSFYFKNKIVNGFEAWKTKQQKQIYYKYYNSSKDFMIGIETINMNDEIILWKTNMTDMKTVKIEKVLGLFNMFYNLPSQRINSWDKFRMPVVDLDLKRSYQEMLQLRFADDVHKNYVISRMEEKIKMKITRSGVEMQAQGQVELMLTAVWGAKYFILDDDFWVFLKQKNKSPYLVAMISSVNQQWTF